MGGARGFLIAIAVAFIVANTSVDASAGRDSLLRLGKGSWTVDDGGPLGPVEVAMTRIDGSWEIKLHAMYPLVDARGHVMELADRAQLWLFNPNGAKRDVLDVITVKPEHPLQAGQAFDATFTIARMSFDSHPDIILELAACGASYCVPSANLAPRP